jgi:hypothetical protein
MAVGGELLLVEVESLPAKPGELIQERFLDVVALVQAERLRCYDIGVENDLIYESEHRQ